MKKDFLDKEQILDHIQAKKITRWIDRLKFGHIFFLWICIVFMFGLAFHYLATDTTFLKYQGQPVSDSRNSIYFSFITATTTGFGDIVPVGFFKIIAIFEVVFGMMLLALVTSKLVSIKQDVILGEIYELSLNEKINRMRSALLLFRQNLSRIITRIEDGSIRKREVSDIYIYIASFEDSLDETLGLMQRHVEDKGSQFTKKIDPVNTELIANSILTSFEKVNELITVMNQNGLEWRREVTVNRIHKCITMNDRLFEMIRASKSIRDNILDDMNGRKNKIISSIRSTFDYVEVMK